MSLSADDVRFLRMVPFRIDAIPYRVGAASAGLLRQVRHAQRLAAAGFVRLQTEHRGDGRYSLLVMLTEGGAAASARNGRA